MIGQLRVVAGPDAGWTSDLYEGQTLILGRGQKSDTQFKDMQVSRIHCEIRVADGKCELIDDESVGGTFVNGQKIRRQVLHNGDAIRIGGTELRVSLLGISDASMLMKAQKPRKAAALGALDLSGQTISHFAVGERIQRGRTGTVYRATDLRDGHPVAFKALHPEYAGDEEEVQRFVRAMKTAVTLKHPNIVALHGAGKNGPVCWLAMEFVEGEPLTSIIERIGTEGMLDWRKALSVGIHVARALEAAHQQHIIHRNVMPSSILIRKPDYVAKLGDLMLAKAMEGLLARQITRPGELVGEVVYMSPERTREGASVDTRSDIYGLGATLYVLLTGRPPFEGRNLVERIAQIRQADPIAPNKFQPELPDALQDAVQKMMAKRPELRHQSPADVVRDLEKIARVQGLAS